MNSLKFLTPTRPLAFAAACTVICINTGCRTAPSTQNFNASATAITGVTTAIEFKSEGEPVDVDGDVEALTLHDAIERALRHNPEIQIRLARVRAALADAKQSRLLPNPILSVVFRFPESGGSPEIEAGLAADLLSLLQMPRQTSAADNRLRTASAEVLVAVLDSLAAVQERLIAVQAAEAEEAVIGQRNQLITRLLDLAKARADAGETSRLDVLVLDAERVEAETELLEARAKRTEHRIALARLLGRPSSAAQWSIPPLQATRFEAPAERTLIDTALNQRPEIQSVKWELAALGDDVARSKLWWTDGGDVGVAGERDGEWAIGPAASLPLPLFDWGDARREKATAHVIEARHRLTQVSRQIVEEVRQASTALAASAELFAKVQNELLPLAQRRHGQAEAQYRSGEVDITLLLQAEQQLLAARSKLIQSQQNLRRAEVRIERAVGRRTLLAQ